MNIDPRFILESGREIYTGSQLLLKGALETAGGVHLLTGHAGAPLVGFFDACRAAGILLRDRGIVARPAANEPLAAAMVSGAHSAGCRALLALSSTGFQAAAEPLAAGIIGGVHGEAGVVVAIGDDPWNDATAIPSDSRFLAQHLRLPLLEPSTPQEVKDWVDVAFRLSRVGQTYVGYLLTSDVAEGGGSVELRPHHYPALNTHHREALGYDKDIRAVSERLVPVPSRMEQAEQNLADGHVALVAEARRLGINRIENRPQRGEKVALGFIAAGSAYAHLTHALEELGLAGRLPILKLGVTYPLDERLVAELAQHCGQLFVIERRRGFVEAQVAALLPALRQAGVTAELWGKKFPGDLPGIPAANGLHPSILIERLVPLIRDHATLPIELTNGRLSRELHRIDATAAVRVNLAERTPTFCAGCPHRDSSSVLLELRRDLRDAEYMSREHRRAPVDLVVHGDVGCSSLLAFEPNQELMQRVTGRGLGGAAAGGALPFITNKHVVFMGDGTFFHSGHAAIRQSIAAGDDVAYIILENKTAAMTGQGALEPEREHADAAAEEKTDKKRDKAHDAPALRIHNMVKALVDKKAHDRVRLLTVNPEDRADYRDAMEKAILAPGVKVVIADKQCAVVTQRVVQAQRVKEERDHGFIASQRFMNVDQEVCENCLECTRSTGCPALTVSQTDHGPKIQTDLSHCVNDGACARIDKCPAFEQVTVVRARSPQNAAQKLDPYTLPEGLAPLHADQDVWRCCVAGVGGMGVGVAARLIVFAGRQMGYQVQFLPIKGVAVRTGGVFSQVVFTRDSRRATTAIVPYGKADLLLAIDALEGGRAVDGANRFRVAAPDTTAAVINTATQPTTRSLMGKEKIDPDLAAAIRAQVRRDRCAAADVSELAQRLMGDKQYVNVMMLGMAFQLGYLPLSLASIEEAIRRVMPADLTRNLKALHLGRAVACGALEGAVRLGETVETVNAALLRKSASLAERFGNGRRGHRVAKAYLAIARPAIASLKARGADAGLCRDFAVRVADCIVWGGLPYCERYRRRVLAVLEHDHARHGLAQTRAVVWNLARAMLIKDEVYVAALLSCPEKRRRDQERFNVSDAAGDRLIYRREHHPEVQLFGRRWGFRWHSSAWQLRALASWKILRTIWPGWHKRDVAYREWYEQLVDRCVGLGAGSAAQYQKWASVLKTPEMVTGFRDVRWPKIEAARAAAETLLARPDEDEPMPPEPRITVSLSSRVIEQRS
jgi:indolepyruvate ferredoxin oxidoreductase